MYSPSLGLIQLAMNVMIAESNSSMATANSTTISNPLFRSFSLSCSISASSSVTLRFNVLNFFEFFFVAVSSFQDEGYLATVVR